MQGSKVLMVVGCVPSSNCYEAPWQRLYFLPEPQGQSEFLETPDALAVVDPSSDGAEYVRFSV